VNALASIKEAAQALGGEVYRGREVLAPGPGHSRNDRSLQVLFDPQAPDGFVVRSYANDDFRECREHVKSALGIATDYRSRRAAPRPVAVADTGRDEKAANRKRWALDLWRSAVDPRDTAVQLYFQIHREGLDLSADICGRVLRYQPACPWRNAATDETERHPAMLALMRDIRTNEAKAIHRTLLHPDGRPQLEPNGQKKRRMLGDATRAVIKLDPDEAITAGICLGEGIETSQSARMLGIRPTWATGSVSTLGVFPVLDALDCIALLGESDKKGANASAVAQVGAAWAAAGKEVVVVKSPHGDVDDARRRGAR